MRALRVGLGALVAAGSLVVGAPAAHAAAEPRMLGLLTENDRPERPDCVVERGTVSCAGTTFKHDYTFSIPAEP